MNTEQEQPGTATPPPPRPRHRGFGPAAIVAIAALAVSAGVWLDNRQSLQGLQQDVAKRLGEVENRSKESRIVAGQAQEGSREALVKLGVLESKVADSQSQQLALEALYQEMSRSRDEWALAEVEQILLTASEQLLLAGNVKAALIALQTADSRLARVDRPQLIPLRKTLTQDIQRLQTMPLVDVAGISLRLDNLAAGVDDLPLAIGEASDAVKGPAPNNVPGGLWTRLAREAWQDFVQLIRIERMENPSAPLLSPSQTTYVRENLRLRLLSARLALLQHDENGYRNDLKAVEAGLNRYFDTRAKSTRTALETVRQLASASIVATLPDISASLNAVRSFKPSKERGGR